MKFGFINKILVGSCVCSLYSCTDLLDKYDPTKLNVETFYQTEKELQQAANGIYGNLQGYVGGVWQYTEMITDNTTMHFNPTDRGQGPGLEAIEYWQIVSTTMDQLNGPMNIYNVAYQHLVNINTVLKKIDSSNLGEEIKNKVAGQMYFMRALYYFDLVRFFGDVVIITEPISTPDEAWTYERSPISKVYELIDSDISQAIKNLPMPDELLSSEIGLPTKGAALVLQGRTYLERHMYSEAIASFKAVTTMGYELLDDYAKVFDPVFKNHKESIMDVQFQGNNELGEQSGFLYNFYPRESYGAVIPFPGVSGGGWNIPTLDIINDYEEGDVRKDISLCEGYMSNDGNWVSVPYINKYNHAHSIQGVPDDNWPLMRYAEVLLSLAEAINELEGPTDEAYSYLNKIRERAHLAPVSGLSKEEFKKCVLHERRIELAFENHRWFDLKRTNTPEELAAFLNAYGKREMTNPTTEERKKTAFAVGDFEFEPYEVYFPVPAREMRLNPNLKQTAGYN